MPAEDTPPSISVHPGDVLAGKYVVDRVLGAGGMGVVVAATHRQLEQKVAIKLMLPQTLEQAELVARFQREARAAAKLRSDHVAHVIDVGVLDSGAPFMVMEYLEGRDLSALVDAEGPLAPGLAVEYVCQACEALGEAHASGIVHRDVKPSNLFLTRTVGGGARIKVLDFGISKLRAPTGLGADAATTKSATVMGSPAYMSPEQMSSSKNVDARTDVWSLGVVLFELVTGRLPWPGATVFEIAAAVMGKPASDAAELRPDLPAGLSRVIDRCLAKDPEDRYQSVAELVEALAPFRSAAAGAPAVATIPQPPATGAVGMDSAELAALPTHVFLQQREGSAGAAPAATGGGTAAAPPPEGGRSPSAKTTAVPVVGKPAGIVARSPWSRPALALAGAVVALTVAGLLLGRYGPFMPQPQDSVATAARSTSMVVVTKRVPAGAQTATVSPSSMPLRYPCADPSVDAGQSYSCSGKARAWCDEAERRIACCGPGLVPTGADGLCGCPPGGVADGPDAPPLCPRSSMSTAQRTAAIQRTMRSLHPGMKECFARSLAQAPGAKGTVDFWIELTPEGRVFAARVKEATWPDPEGQACTLALVRAAPFPPPVGGAVAIAYPVALTAD
ncbi:MAG: serine/threonine protein kinase [Deltaproteobacteria bacterium]|nr:serine/threonine protein kinase [Deltaproteobacteria bacterium]